MYFSMLTRRSTRASATVSSLIRSAKYQREKAVAEKIDKSAPEKDDIVEHDIDVDEHVDIDDVIVEREVVASDQVAATSTLHFYLLCRFQQDI